MCSGSHPLSSSCSELAAKHLFFFFFFVFSIFFQVSIHFGYWSKVELNQKLMSVKSMLDSLNVSSGGAASNQWYVGASLASPNPAPVCTSVSSCTLRNIVSVAWNCCGGSTGRHGNWHNRVYFFFRKLVIKELSAH